MKSLYKTFALPGILTCILFFTILSGCSNNSTNPVQTASGVKVTYLVSDEGGSSALHQDDNLVNAWGMAFDQSGYVTVASNGKGLIITYDRNGVRLSDSITVPSPNPAGTGSPSGLIFNNTSDFIIQVTGEKAQFIMATEEGVIAAWSSSGQARIVSDRSAFGAVYKAIAMAHDGGQNFIYATNFKARTIDVFDKNFSLVTSKVFLDPAIPSDYGPFGISNIDGNLYVTYAKLKPPDNKDDQSGAGYGYVDIFNTNGTLMSRFASLGVLNSPWGITKGPASFGSYGGKILVGNFGDGHINAFDNTGKFLFAVSDSATSPITISGLWSITFSSDDNNTLYFTSGPGDENHGRLGYIKIR